MGAKRAECSTLAAILLTGTLARSQERPACGNGRFRLTTFEEALPHAFSAASFMPGRVDEFLSTKR